MDNSQGAEFQALVSSFFEVLGKDAPSTPSLRLWWSMLRQYDFELIENSFTENLSRNKFAPTPSDILEILKCNDGRPTAEEAWAIASKAQCESETIVWTDEIAYALNAGAGDLLADGDKVAARMAFRDSYNRELQKARDDGKPVHCWVSLGHCTAGREAAIDAAIAKGLLGNESKQRLLPNNTKPTKEALALVGTIAEPDKELRAKAFAEMKGKLK